MGAFKSKEQEDENEKFVNDPSLIYWDEFGNLTYGKSHSVKQEKQIRSIMELDHVDDEDGKEWFIVDSAWISSWLAYVHFDTQNAPSPGPCDNKRLIAWDYTESKYIGRFGLFMAVKDRAGDYRRVSKETWEKFCSWYPGSGPSITMQFVSSDSNDSGIYDTSKWNIMNPPPPPEHKDKKKKKKFFRLKGKDIKDGDQPAADSSVSETNNSVMDSESATQLTSGTTDKGGKYEIISPERGSHASGDGLLAEEHVRQTSVARDSYVENVFFGKDK